MTFMGMMNAVLMSSGAGGAPVGITLPAQQRGTRTGKFAFLSGAADLPNSFKYSADDSQAKILVRFDALRDFVASTPKG
jgi:hypothetical protein